MEDPPEVTEPGLASMLTRGGNELTVTVVDWVAEPLGPVQVISYSVVLDKAPVDHVPLVASCPLQPPEAKHRSALLVVQVRVELPPLLTVVGEATRVIAGAPGGVTVTCFDSTVGPPVPVQVSI